MRVAMVQMTAIRNDKEANLLKMETFIKKASEENASIVCFPELSITGYSKRDPSTVAETVNGPSVQRLKALASRYNLTILAGMAELHEEQVFISHLSIQPGEEIEVYRKTHLGAREKISFSQGHEIPVFNTNISGKKSKFGIGLCYDLHYPELVTSMAVQGAKIIFAPHAAPIGGVRRLAIRKMKLSGKILLNSFIRISRIISDKIFQNLKRWDISWVLNLKCSRKTEPNCPCY